MKITAFITLYCPWSPGVIAFLNERGLDYEIKDITRDRMAYDEMVEKERPIFLPLRRDRR